jgi:hypothetical protein
LYNKRIKIKPYPNFQISNECFENDWRNKGVPDEYRNIFIEKEGKDIELFLNIVFDKYYKK